MPQEFLDRLRRLKLLVLDVDGTLTDGGIYLGPNGEELKRFDVHDGHGIAALQRQFGVEVMFLSGRSSIPVEVRAAELGVRTCLQGHFHKDAVLKAEIDQRGFAKEEVAVMGDDLGDLAMMQFAGMGFAPANAIQSVKEAADYTTERLGGRGAVREVCDLIMEAKAPAVA